MWTTLRFTMVAISDSVHLIYKELIHQAVVVPICKVYKHGQSVTRFKLTQFAAVEG